MTISSLMDAVNLADRVAIPTNHRAAFDVVVQTTLWILWRFRNETCFSSKRPSKRLILNDIKLSSFNSISCRLTLQEKVEQVTKFSRATFVARENPLNDKSLSDVAQILIDFLVKVRRSFPGRHVARDKLV
ncbi:hypothetical protein Tco_1546919 [Tanacetum coccineum]